MTACDAEHTVSWTTANLKWIWNLNHTRCSEERVSACATILCLVPDPVHGIYGGTIGAHSLFLLFSFMPWQFCRDCPPSPHLCELLPSSNSARPIGQQPTIVLVESLLVSRHRLFIGSVGCIYWLLFWPLVLSFLSPACVRSLVDRILVDRGWTRESVVRVKNSCSQGWYNT